MATVAIDFGTTTSFVARRDDSGPATVLPLSPGTPYLPSVVAFDGAQLVVGDEDSFAPEQLIRSVKRAITDRQQDIVTGDGVILNADEVIGAIFTEIRERAGSALDDSEVRLGCPAMWDGQQRKRLIQIAKRAGLALTEATLVDEPVAAGLSWLADHPEPVSGRVLVFDMGGGTLDVAVLEISGKEVTVLSSRGNPVAGDKLDDTITADLKRRSGVDFSSLRKPAQALGLLGRMAREAKIALSTQELHTVVLPAYVFGKFVEIDYTREEVEEAFHPLMVEAEQVIAEALLEAQLKERFSDAPRSGPARFLGNDIDYVLLVGGMSQIPYVRQRLAARLPDVTFVPADPVEAVVKGLTDNTGYERINLHRPAFDFILEWNGGSQRRLLYEAYTPLYQEWQAKSGRARLNYERRGRGLRLPRQGRGHLRVVSPTGKPVRLAVDGTDIDRLPVRFGHHELIFKIYCDGQLVLTDGMGKQTAMRVDRWPVIKNRDDAALELKKVSRKPMDAPPIWFVGGPS
ncbi:Hsp70 family protein [Catelliglobosispora koreensis]|uniref:Hsp70 family protein n=1 Tax=Catelliglobosispora koreensis TaxID=129052 RepID=UPI00035EFE46|nr:Hsp70 family protein [Catelliglobosispora koreensis]